MSFLDHISNDIQVYRRGAAQYKDSDTANEEDFVGLLPLKYSLA
jgi:hypothetical protein